jgi:sialic acid synthase SpsE/mannose-6-phosphate isomerase-like protein (cupin superfamily)
MIQKSAELFDDLFIFEMANNHQGDVEHGKRIIRAMGEIGRNRKIKAAVKLQYRNLDTFIHPDFRHNTEAKHISRFLSTELSKEQFRELVREIKVQGLVSVCTPFDEDSVQWIIDHEIEIIKVASCSADDWPLLDRIVGAGKPVIASTGGLQLPQIDNLINFLSHREVEFAILHCVGIYPSPNELLNMRFIERLRKRYPEIIFGYSGHEAPDNLGPVLAATALGASIFERHVGVPTENITLNAYSMSPEQADAWVAAALEAKSMCGSVEKSISSAESESLLSLKRGVFFCKSVEKGQAITREDIYFAMPCGSGQVTSSDFGKFRAKFIASKNYSANEALIECINTDEYHNLRLIIHEAKGLLSEAGIVLMPSAEIELSHHYGIQRFREFGLLIVNLINREYCKKILIIFPGQHHPEQYHIKKEETFHVLSGELILSLNGIKRQLTKGDIVTIERGVKHAFWSIKGSIIEEVSTTHFRNDSFYTDEKISILDPMQRKTIITEF